MPYASEQRVVLLISAHLPVRYLRNNAVPVGESARDAARGVNPWKEARLDWAAPPTSPSLLLGTHIPIKAMPPLDHASNPTVLELVALVALHL